MLVITKKWYLMLYAALKATRRSMSLDQTELPSKVLSMPVIEDHDVDVEDTEEEVEDVDTENLNEREIERSALETKVSVSVGDLLNLDARGEDQTAGTTLAVKNRDETGEIIPEKWTIVTLGLEDEIITQLGLTTTQGQLPARVHHPAVEVGVVDLVVEGVVEVVLDVVEVVVDAELLTTGTVIITSTTTTVLDREVVVEMTITEETPTMTETIVGTELTVEIVETVGTETRTRVVVEGNRATATAAAPANHSSSENNSPVTAVKLQPLRAELTGTATCMIFEIIRSALMDKHLIISLICVTCLVI